MARTGLKAKGRREAGAFVPFPTSVLNHPNFTRLSPKAVKLLMDLCAQLRFKQGGPVNNGDLCAAWSLMQPRGWRSEETLVNALAELLHFGFVVRTRIGGQNRCALYAVTWWALDECGGKLDMMPTRVLSNEWRDERADFVPRRRTTKPRKNHRKKQSLPRPSG